MMYNNIKLFLLDSGIFLLSFFCFSDFKKPEDISKKLEVVFLTSCFCDSRLGNNGEVVEKKFLFLLVIWCFWIYNKDEL